MKSSNEICKYCHGKKYRKMIQTDGTEALGIEPDNTLGILPEFVKAKINYCPMCGRYLGDTHTKATYGNNEVLYESN